MPLTFKQSKKRLNTFPWSAGHILCQNTNKRMPAIHFWMIRSIQAVVPCYPSILAAVRHCDRLPQWTRCIQTQNLPFSHFLVHSWFWHTQPSSFLYLFPTNACKDDKNLQTKGRKRHWLCLLASGASKRFLKISWFFFKYDMHYLHYVLNWQY